MPSPCGWRVFASAVVLGLVLAGACLVAGLLALRLLTTAESMRLLPAHVLTNALRMIGIRWAPFALSVQGLLLDGGFFLGVWIVVRRTTGLTWASLGWRAAPLRAYLLVPPVYIATLLCSGLALRIEAALFFHGHLDQITNPKNDPQQAEFAAFAHPSVGEVLLLFLAVAVVAPLVEELVFRGMLFQLLRRPLPLWGAVVLSAFVFAVVHGIPVLLPDLFLCGVALALVFHYTRSLYCSTFLHVLTNTVVVVGIVTNTVAT
jgi:membrane protease YdiL (CAAX protease family)